MPVRLRLSIHGKRNTRIFHIVAIHAGKSRDSKPLETLGIFSPRIDPDTREKRVEWSVERLRYWLGVGAQPSETVLSLMERAGIVPRRPKPWDPSATLAPTTSYPTPSPEHVRKTAPGTEKQRKERDARERQLEITRQWTHNMGVLRRGAKGGVPGPRRRRPEGEGGPEVLPGPESVLEEPAPPA